MRLRIYSKPRKKTSTPEGSTRKIERSGPEFRGNYLSDVSDFLSRAANQLFKIRSASSDAESCRLTASSFRRAIRSRFKDRLTVLTRLILILFILTLRLMWFKIRIFYLEGNRKLLTSSEKVINMLRKGGHER
jgi:hypothetical protein